MKNTYEEAIRTLNGLQSSTAEKRNRELTRGDAQQEEKIVQMEEIMKRLGVKMGDVDRLRVIHVSGTKGKGSTCAFCESILHHCGYRTGLFTSPHLVEVRDRFHVNGRRLTKDQFSMYFWKCYELLEETRDHYNGFMPTYFKFLTGMGLYLFIQEKVEVAIIEVGIGGAYDCTNVVKHPSVCGVASLGYDHTRILGDTIESIAWHKAGILKKCVPAFTVNQEVGGMNILCERAAEIGAVLSVAPDLSCYPGPLPDLGLSGKYQETNATLALQLCNTWIQMNRKRPYNCHHDGMPSSIGTEANAITTAPVFDITKEFRLGLRNCWWPGRSQMISRPGWTLFVDGAHTVASTKACMEWFSQASTEDEKDRDCSVTRILIFHCTGGRIARPLLKQIQVGGFDIAIFCPNVARLDDKCFADQTSFKTTYDQEMQTCSNNQLMWNALSQQSKDTFIFPCILDAFQWFTEGRDPLVNRLGDHVNLPHLPDCAVESHLQVLVCGSVLLVGAVFRALGQELAPIDRPYV